VNGVLPPAATAINLLSNSEVAERDDKLRLATAAVQNQESVASALAAHVRSCFEQAESYRRTNGITERLLDAQRRRRGVYSATKLAQIRALGGSELHTHDTEVKCNAAEALIEDVLAPMGEKIWSIEATPMPDIPDDLKANIVQATLMKLAMEVQEGGEIPDEAAIREYAQNLREEIEDELKAIAKERADRMSLLMDDQIVEMKFRDVFSEFLSNLVTYGTGFIEGPIVIRRRDMAWEGADYAVSERHVLAAEAPSPFDMYPQPDKVKMEDGWIIRRRRMSGKDLSLAKKLQGYIEREIVDLLTTKPRGHREYLADDQERADNELKGDSLLNEGCYYDVLDMWGSIAGAMLEEFGMKGLVPTDFYDVRVATCANRVIRVMPNPDPLGRHPYYVAQYKKVVGSLWGSGVPHLIAPSQDLANAAIRAIANNMGIASGPMVAIDVSRLPPGTNIETLHPWQLFQFRNPNGTASDPIKFFQPDSNVQALMIVYDRALQKMDDESGIPAYSYGNEDVAGAGRTMGGLSMLLNASAKSIKEAMVRIDQDVLAKFMERLYVWNMVYSPDADIKGDAKVSTYGASRNIMHDMKLARLMDFADRHANPIDMQVLGLGGRAEIMRIEAELIDKRLVRLIPTVDAMQQIQARMAAAGADPAAMAGETGGRNTAGTPSRTARMLPAG
jgi:hypothetical protein